MIRTGLVSVTFRQLSRKEIVHVAHKANLEGIEWGGDVHVPPGDLVAATEAKSLTLDAGLHVAAYGSYWRFEKDESRFEAVVETALAVGAPLIRVWAGATGSASTSVASREVLTKRIRTAATIAHQAKVTLALEYHGGTLTDTADSALQLIESVSHPNLRLLWQPDPTRSHPDRLQDLKRVLPFLANLHVFQWTKPEHTVLRHPLVEGESEWRDYLQIVKQQKRDRFALLEFVPNDDPTSLPAEAEVLRRWLAHQN